MRAFIVACLLLVPSFAADDGAAQFISPPEARPPPVMAFARAHNYALEGVVTRVNPDERWVMVDRKDLPSAQLPLADQTQLTLNGRTASLAQLKPGDEVRASFNVASGVGIVVVKIDAKDPPRAHGRFPLLPRRFIR